MKIQLNNFGPIKKFDFDLSKDLTIVFGKNNIGKSYAISAIYLILKSFRVDEFIENRLPYDLYVYRRNPDQRVTSRVIQQVIHLEKNVFEQIHRKSEFEINSGLKRVFTRIISELLIPKLEKSFSSSFSSIDSLQNKLNDERLAIIVQFKSFELTITVNAGKLTVTNLTFYEKVIVKKSAKTKKSERKGGKYLLYFNTKSKRNKSQIIDSIFLEYYTAFTNEISEAFENIYFLPASRSGLYQALSAFNAVIAELSKSRTFLSSKLELPNISEPVLDYFLSLANVAERNISKEFSQIVNLIETNILNGQVSFNPDNRKLVFSPNNIEGELDLAFTSSMISEIAPIVAFFKYVIPEFSSHRRFRHSFKDYTNTTQASSLIFIEEPEAHLHPEIQIVLMDIFCEIVKHNVKIVMSTHSNYMFNKLSNLILAKRINHESVSSCLMEMGEEGSTADIVSMAASIDGMVDENFADVAEKLYEERIQLYDKLNSDAT